METTHRTDQSEPRRLPHQPHHSLDLDSSPEYPLDLVIVGAGIAAVDLSHHVKKNFPQWRWRVFDSNTDIGGT